VDARDIGFAYGRSPVLSDVSLRVSPGEFVALVGPNGSGKSTLLRIMLGLLAPMSGSVRLFGTPPRDLRDRSRLGYVPQRPVLGSDVPATVEEMAGTGCLSSGRWWRRLTRHDREDVRRAIEAVGLGDHASRPVSELSGGQQQRAFIARALVSAPELLVLDEPVAGIDAESQRLFRDALLRLIEERGAGVLLVSHELSAVAAHLDRVVVLKQRVLFDGPPHELTATGVALGPHPQDMPLWLEGLT
jgi:zinc transport system ATP-binding protein